MEMVERLGSTHVALGHVELIHPGSADFRAAVESILGRAPDEILEPALPYSVVVRNNDSRAMALLGIRFDLVGARGQSYSVIHYADTLRHPEKAELRPGTMRFVCAEPRYTDLVLRGDGEVDQRARMNLAKLQSMVRVRAALDCVGFDDGQFAGVDSLGAFERFEREREAEIAFLAEIRDAAGNIEAVLERAVEIPANRALARRLREAFAAGGAGEAVARARSHRLRIPLWR